MWGQLIRGFVRGPILEFPRVINEGIISWSPWRGREESLSHDDKGGPLGFRGHPPFATSSVDRIRSSPSPSNICHSGFDRILMHMVLVWGDLEA
ncbi:unnamed protein product [Musa acuminata subsp. burmannicoides]